MGKSRVGRSGLVVDRPLDLSRFYALLHQCIGGSGPEGLAWDKELPDTSLDPDAFRIEYLWSEIASKFNPASGKTKQARIDKAMALFRESEEACSEANTNLSRGSYRSQRIIPDVFLTLDAVLFTASVKIASLLGKFRWNECDDLMGFGTGASFDVPRKKASSWFKFESKLDVNPMSIPLSLAVLAGRPAWCRSLISKGGCVVPNPKNRLTTVPKNYKRERVIAVEPLMGIYIQKGIGGVIRKRLKRAGINLNDQGANRLGAFVGSLDSSLATIDLKSASDTISQGIVQQLLPPDWLCALEQCRSQLGVLDSGEKILYRKFSSMGAGFTFELETLIFWGICSAVLDLTAAEDRRLLVYGDDIVVPAVSSEAVIRALELCGFTPNLKKTHIDGPFRESCGKHYLNGYDVTPFYVKSEVRTAGDIFLLHNNLMRWASRGFACDNAYRRSFDGKLPLLLEWIRSHLPSCQKPTICDGYGDSGFIGSFDEVLPAVRKYWPAAGLSNKEKRLGKKSSPHHCEHFAMDHWPEVADTKRVGTSGVIPLALGALDRKADPFQVSSGIRLSLHELSLWLADGIEDSPPICRVVARNRALKTLRVPLRLWYEIGPWL